MIINFNKDEYSDHSGPVIDMYASNLEEALNLGMLFNQIISVKCTVWNLGNGIRIPLVLADENGLAVTYKNQG